MQDRQLRNWLFIVYPGDNPNHSLFLKELKNSAYDFFYIKHKPHFDEDGNITKKLHAHGGIFFPVGIRKSTLIKKFYSLNDSDMHLFKGLDELKQSNGKRQFKTIDNYIDYTTHISNDDKSDKYDFDDFVSNIPDRIRQAINKKDYTKLESFSSLVDFIDKTYSDRTINSQFWDFTTWFKYCNDNGYGDIFYSNWYKVRDILKDYINSIISN